MTLSTACRYLSSDVGEERVVVAREATLSSTGRDDEFADASAPTTKWNCLDISRGLASFESESVHPVGRYSNADVGESQRGRYGFRDNRKDLFGGERGVETPS